MSKRRLRCRPAAIAISMKLLFRLVALLRDSLEVRMELETGILCIFSFFNAYLQLVTSY